MQETPHDVKHGASPRTASRPRRQRSVHPIERLTTYTTAPTIAVAATARSAFERRHEWMKDVPPVDMNRHIPFSWVRCIMSIISFTLLVSDIPRSGLGIESPTEFYPDRTAPDTLLFFEPVPYPVAHVTCQPIQASINTSGSASSTIGSNCSGWEGSEPIQQASAWSYGYDTTSIGMRGFAELFNPLDFPDFLLERDTDPRIRDLTASIELETVFRMIDGILTAAQQATGSRHEKAATTTLWFASQYQWIDRLHQYLMRGSLQNLRWRMNSLHFRSSPPGGDLTNQALSRPVRASPASTGKRDTAFATYVACEHFIKWRCPYPQNSSQGFVSIADHLPMRLVELQQRYPDLWTETVVIATQEMVTTSSLLSRAMLHNFESSEVVVLTRGRSCFQSVSSTGSSFHVNAPMGCSTVFVDDYRYERNMIISNVADWYFVTAALRGTAQLYVWTRLALLAYMSYIAQPRRHRSTRDRATLALLSIFKIPFQVVVYGSIIPIALYVFAYFIDASFIESKLDSLWTTVRGGYSNVDKLAFLRACTMQMRNVWLLALLAKVPVFLQTRDNRWRPHMGVRGVRGLAINFASMLSIFGPYRSLYFRNSANLLLTLLGDQHEAGRFGDLKNEPSLPSNQLPLPVGGSLVMTVLAIAVMLGLDVLLTLVSCAFHREWRGHEILFGSSIFVPHSAGTLWPVSALAIRFHLNDLVDVNGRRSRSVRNTLHHRSSISPDRLACSRPARSPPTRVDIHGHGPVATGPASSEPSPNSVFTNTDRRRSIDVCDRSATARAVVQLMNVTMMSDPWTLFRLRFIGVMLFVYRVAGVRFADVDSAGASASVVILPYAPADVGEWTGLTEQQFALVDVVSSREVPLSLLLQAG